MFDYTVYTWTSENRVLVGTDSSHTLAVVAKPGNSNEASLIPLLLRNPSPQVVSFIGEFTKDNIWYIVMMKQALLRDKLPSLTAKDLSNALEKLLLGLLHLKKLGIVHHDIKVSNILWDAVAGPQFCDFGMSVKFQPNSLEKRQIITCPWLYPDKNEHSVIPDKSCSSAVDVYQLGLVFSEICFPKSGPELIWKQQRCSLFHDNLATYLHQQCFQEIDKLKVDLITKMVNDDPDTRITVEVALKHELFVHSKLHN